MPTRDDSIKTWTVRLLQQAARYFQETHHQAYLVGGAVRNLLLQETNTDWDIVTNSDATNAARLARHLANHLGGFFVHLHEKASRIIIKREQQEIIIDVSPQQGDSIEEDLRWRDFTVNALATPLTEVVHYLATGEMMDLIDPFHGVADLKAHRLRAVSDGIFQQDPLRMLRAIRFMMRYHFDIEPTTAQKIIRDAKLLPNTAAERIHEELYAILRPTGATERLRYLDTHGLFTTLFPEFIPARGMKQPSLHHWDVLDHSLETITALEQLTSLLQAPQENIRNSPYEISDDRDMEEVHKLLQEAEQQGIFTYAMLGSPQMKLAALLHDIGKPSTYAIDDEENITFYHHPQVGVPLAQQVMKRLSTSVHDRRTVQQVVAHHMRPGQLSHSPVTPRAIRRYFVDLGPNGIYVGLVALADHLSMRGPEPLTIHWQRHLATVRLLLTKYIRERDKILPPRLLQPDELMRRLNIEPGPLVGQLLESIAEAQAEGLIHSKEEALWFAEERLQQS